jgi:hypothetical protein
MIVTAVRIPVPLPIAPKRSAAMESDPRMALVSVLEALLAISLSVLQFFCFSFPLTCLENETETSQRRMACMPRNQLLDQIFYFDRSFKGGTSGEHESNIDCSMDGVEDRFLYEVETCRIGDTGCCTELRRVIHWL